jgi:hypothetical protein
MDCSHLGMDLISGLEKKLRSFFAKGQIEQAIELTLDSIEEALQESKKRIPASAEPWLRLKYRCNWPTGSGAYHDDKDYQQKRKWLDDQFGLEHNLLEAKHPKRVERLWKEARPIISERYGIRFRNREQLARLTDIFQRRGLVIEKAARLEDSWHRYRQLTYAHEEEPGKGWDEVAALWKDNELIVDAHSCAEELIGFRKDIRNPRYLTRIIHDDFDDEDDPGRRDLLSPSQHSVNLGRRPYDQLWRHQLEYVSKLIIQAKAGKLSFADALDIIKPDYARISGLVNRRGRLGDLPPNVLGMANDVVRSAIKNPGKDEECTAFQNWYTAAVLHRWKQTAPDYDRILDYYIPIKDDKNLIRLFYDLRGDFDIMPQTNQGNLPALRDAINKREYELLEIARLPGLLRELVKEGWITETVIDPPLRTQYLKPDQIYSSKMLPESSSDIGLALAFSTPQSSIETRVTPSLLQNFDDNLPMLRNDVEGLRAILDPDKNYIPLFIGNHTMFITSEGYYPNGSQRMGDVYRLSLIRPGSVPKDGVRITVQGRDFNVRLEKSYEQKNTLTEMLYDAHSDLASAPSIAVIVDKSPEEFRQTYFKDFMAHVLMHRSDLMGGFSECQQIFSSIDSSPNVDRRISLGPMYHTLLRTYTFAGRFAFQLKYDHERWNMGEPLLIAKSLIRYLDDVGLPYHVETDLDESARAQVQKKIEDREFYAEHFENIRDTLRPENLAEILCGVLVDERYGHFRLGSAQTECSVCGEHYMQGRVYRKDLHEDRIEGVDLYELHSVVRHPDSFVSKFGNLQKIHRMVGNYTPAKPLIIHYPDLADDFASFIQAHRESVKADSEGFDFWMNTQGGVNAEEEEIEDNPDLQDLLKKENELQLREREMGKYVNDAAISLQKKYEVLNPAAKQPEYLLNFWSNQVMMFEIYRLTAPQALLRFRGHRLMDLDAGFLMG